LSTRLPFSLAICNVFTLVIERLGRPSQPHSRLRVSLELRLFAKGPSQQTFTWEQDWQVLAEASRLVLI
jgi:hypothetical protein